MKTMELLKLYEACDRIEEKTRAHIIYLIDSGQADIFTRLLKIVDEERAKLDAITPEDLRP